MMKRNLFLCLMVMILLSSCQKEVRKFEGDYSYKISGSITVITEDSSYVRLLENKIGQMNIVPVKDDDSRVMITMNESAGRVDVLYGTVSGNQLTLDPYSFSMTELLGVDETGIYSFTASGKGELTDDMLIIREQWNGKKLNEDTETTLKGDDIVIVAQRN